MCGIMGTLPKSDHQQFKSSLSLLAHRGPDGYGIWNSEDDLVTLGHRRLAILDLSENGKQPLFYDRFAITFNGEIYNFLEIRKELKAKGHQFYTESDTEVILVAYLEWGKECLLRFNGMWSMAIWDKQKKELFVTRDRFGKKPFFYAFTKGKFVFASEMKAILPYLEETKPSADFEWCKRNIWLYESTDKTLVEGIKRLPAGHFAYIKPGQTQLLPIKYWETLDHLVEVPKTYDEQVQAFRELLHDACAIRMRSDVPIGTALSGGIDSSVIICTMANLASQQHEREQGNWQNAFIATFPGSQYDEKHYADAVVNHLGINAHYTTVHSTAPPEKLEYFIGMFEELNQAMPLPVAELYGNMRKSGVVVTIDGHGADELLGGYPESIDYLLKDTWGNKDARIGLLEARKAMTPDLNVDNIGLAFWGKTMARHYGRDFMQVLGKVGLYNGRIPLRTSPKINALSNFDSYLYDIFHHTIMPTLLRNFDRCSMMNSIEIRMPFLDHRIVSFLFSIGWEAKYKNGFTKAILRDAAKPELPAKIYNRKSKIGFGLPIDEAIRGGWKDYILDSIHSSAFRNCDLINPKSVAKKMLNIIEGGENNFIDATRAWTDFMPYMWERYFLKKAVPTEAVAI